MTNSVRDDVQTSPRPTRIPPDHARHDRLLVTRLAADDAFPSEEAEARALIDACHDCAALAADIAAIRSLTAELPAPRRTRDFRLSTEQAEKLRGSGLQRLLRRLAVPGVAQLRPVAGAAMSLGLALAVVGAALPVPQAPPEQNAAIFRVDASSEEEAAAPGQDSGEGSLPASGPEIDTGSNGGVSPQEVPVAGDNFGAYGTAAGETSFARELLIYAGLLLALLSLGVLLAVTLARRRGTDPLLR